MATKMRRMVSMERTPDEKMEAMMPASLVTSGIPDVPPGLCICLTDAELEKLDIDDECEVGDYLHLFAMARVSSVNKTDNGCRIELALTSLGVEEENYESEPDDEDE